MGRTSARFLAGCAILLAAACGHGDGEEPCALRARPLAPAVGFDANSDGTVDVADGAWLATRGLREGADPPCLAAVEAYDAVRDVGTAYAIWYSLVSGTAQPTLADGACPAPTPSAGACGDGLALAIDAPKEASGPAGGAATFDATVTLTSPALAIEAWSVSVAATGCTVTEATVAGTLAADRRDDPPGQRDGGVGMAQASAAGGAVSLVALDPVGGSAVRPHGDAVLVLHVSAPVGPSCGTCALALADGQAGRGRPLTNAVSAGGRSYAPATSDATIEVCPP